MNRLLLSLITFVGALLVGFTLVWLFSAVVERMAR